MSLLDEIKRNEGYRKTVYKDHLGNLTIGYGFLIKSLELEEDICELIVQRKLEKNKKILIRKIKNFEELPIEAQEVLEDMFYQLHYKLFQFKKTLKHIERFEYIEASKEMLDSLWARQCPDRALRNSNKIAQCVQYNE